MAADACGREQEFTSRIIKDASLDDGSTQGSLSERQTIKSMQGQGQQTKGMSEYIEPEIKDGLGYNGWKTRKQNINQREMRVNMYDDGFMNESDDNDNDNDKEQGNSGNNGCSGN